MIDLSTYISNLQAYFYCANILFFIIIIKYSLQ